MKFRALIVSAIVLSSVPALGQVDDRARGAARALAQDGVAALQSGDTASAVDKLERAYQIIKLPTVGLWSARALVKAGRLVNAEERYNDVMRSTVAGDVQGQAKTDAAKERDELLPRLPHVTIVVDGAPAGDVTVTLDGDSVMSALIGTAQPVDPKHHVLRGTRGKDVVEQPFDIAESQQSTVTLKFGAATATATVAPSAPAAGPATPATQVAAPAAAPAPSDAGADQHGSFWNTPRKIGVVVGGAGVVAGIVGGVFLIDALGKKSDADKYCKGTACTDPRGVTSLSDAHSAGNVATIAGIAGLVLVGAGVVLFATAPKTSESASVAIAPAYVTGGGAVVTAGRF